MGLNPGRNKRLESAVSIILLGVLFFVGLAIVIVQFDVDMGRFGIVTPAVPPPLQQANAKVTSQPAFDSLVPEGFVALAKPETYGPENLYEKINGKAPLYLDAGFVGLSTQRFISKNDENLWMELFIYDMADVENAFSVYSVQKRLDSQLVRHARFAYRTSSSLYFVHGGYYVELLGSAQSPELLKAMEQVFEGTGDALPIGRATEIPELTVFPAEGLVAGSGKLYLANAFGFEGLTDVFTAGYELGSQTVTAFLGRRPDSRQASDMAQRYYDFLVENDAVPKATSNEAVNAVSGRVLDYYGTTEIVFAVGPFFGGVHEAENGASAEALAERLIRRLMDVQEGQK
jgi:hypothetical protein